MKQFTMIAFALLLGMASIGWTAPNQSWRADVGVDATASVTQMYAAPDAFVTFTPGLLGIGGGLKTYIGVHYGDILLSPYVHGEIGSFYLNLGAVFEAKGPVSRSGKVAVSINDLDVPVSPLLSLGWNPTLTRNQSGAWKLDIGLEGFISTVYVDEPQNPGEGIGFALVAPLTLTLNIPKINIGVAYSFGNIE